VIVGTAIESLVCVGRLALMMLFIIGVLQDLLKTHWVLKWMRTRGGVILHRQHQHTIVGYIPGTALSCVEPITPTCLLC